MNDRIFNLRAAGGLMIGFGVVGLLVALAAARVLQAFLFTGVLIVMGVSCLFEAQA